MKISPLKWYKQKLVRRLAIPPLVLSVIAVSVVSFTIYYVAMGLIEEKVVARLQLSADLHEAEMQRWVADQKKSVVFISRASIVRDRIAELLSYEPGHPYYERAFRDISEYLFAYIKNFEGLREISVLSNHGGRVLFSTTSETEGEYRATDSFFIKGQESLFVQGVYPWRGTSEPTITIAKPLLDASGEKKGVLAVHLNLERLDEILSERVGDTATEETYLVDQFNSLISAERFGRKDFPRGVHSQGIDRAVSGAEGYGSYLNHVGHPVVGYYRWDPELKVALISEISREEAFAPARRLGLFIAGTGFSLICLLIVTAVIAAHNIARPLLIMSQLAAEITEGDFSIRMPVLNSDETGDLARSFNSMIAQINVVHEELENSATHFRSVFQLSPDAIGVQRADDGVLIDVNDSFCNMFGFVPEEVTGKSTDDLGIWGRQRDRTRLMALLRRFGQVERFEARFRRKNGQWFEGVVSSRQIELDGIPHVISVLLDVSSLRQTERDLFASRERLQLLIDRMPIGCITWNTDFTVGLWNPEAERIFGYPASEAIGRSGFDLIVPEHIQPLVAPVWEKLLQGDDTAHNENPNVTRDGTSIICDWYNTPLKNDAGDTVGVISMVRDITAKKQAEEAVRHAAELQQIIINAIPAPIYFKDSAGVYQGCNAAFAEYLGLSTEEIVGHSVYDVAPPDKAAVYEAADAKLIAEEGIQVYEAKVRYADGTDRDVVFHKAVYRNPDGSIGGIVGNMLDVTDMLRAEQALNASERSYREIFNASSEAIIVRDLETLKIIDVNQAMLNMYGFSREEAFEQSIDDLVTDENDYSIDRVLEKVEMAKAGKPQLYEWRSRRKDGTFFWVEVALKKSEILGKNCLLAVIRDIEERKRSETALIESEERFRHLVENAADALYLHDAQGQIVSVNQRSCDQLGYSREELCAMTIAQIEHGVDPDELKAAWGRFTPGESISIDGRHVRKDGSSFPVEVNVVRYDSHGRKLFIALARDVSERKRQEAELDKYRGQLEELVRERTRQLELAQQELVAKERLAVLGQLTATVSHELRNPLGTVKNAIYLLGKIRGEEHAEKIAKTLELANRNVMRCDGIINELLDFTRRQELKLKPTDLGEWLQTILSEQTLPDDVILTVTLPAGVMVAIDPERLRRAFINILTNGLQALERSPGDQKLLTLDLAVSSQKAWITLADNGPGIPAEVMERIYEPMFSTRNFGVGLGMSIVRNIMEEHNGGVEVDSQPGEGATVTLWLPC